MARNATSGLKELVSSSYYPFGLEMADQGYTTGTANPYRYNGKELQTFLSVAGRSLEWYDYGARFYEPAIGRWQTIDPLAEKFRRWSSYNYCMDNPLKYTDPDGMDVYYNASGVRLGVDELKTNNIRIVKGEIAKGFYGKNGVVNSKIASKVSSKMSELSNSKEDKKTMESVVRTIYKENFKNDSYVTFRGLKEDSGFGDHDGGYFTVGLSNGRFNEELDDYYNLATTLVHERFHTIGVSSASGTIEREARAYLEEISSKLFSQATGDWKKLTVDNIAYYLSLMPLQQRESYKLQFSRKLGVNFNFKYNNGTGYYDYSWTKR